MRSQRITHVMPGLDIAGHQPLQYEMAFKYLNIVWVVASLCDLFAFVSYSPEHCNLYCFMVQAKAGFAPTPFPPTPFAIW